LLKVSEYQIADVRRQIAVLADGPGDVFRAIQATLPAAV
jgi:hypothetical protein